MKDHIASFVIRLLAPILRFAAHANPKATRTGRALKDMGIEVYQRHYYHPFIVQSDLRHPLTQKRALPGIALRLEEQAGFVGSLDAIAEMQRFVADESPDSLNYSFATAALAAGDGDVLYGIIRKFKPATIIEIGAGSSTKLAQHALRKNTEEDPGFSCRHVCIEPYEQPWLEKLGIEVIRERAEVCGTELFANLKANDILFIDSSHIIRPQGDVLFEILELLPTVPKGVFVHIHDIFSPRDYPEEWLFERKLLWNEQYLVEAFLSNNSDFEICVALNWLTNEKRAELVTALPGLAWNPDAEPGSLWIRRV